MSRNWRTSRPAISTATPTRGCPTNSASTTRARDEMAAIVSEFADAGWLNLVGGCCGTTPEHIRAIAEAVAGKAVHQPVAHDSRTRLSGMEPFVIRPDSNFTMIGERTNVTGSRRFARLIKTGDFETALEVARDQVEGGANVLDVNMDEGLLDSEAADDDVPQPRRRRARDRAHPDHDRQLEVLGPRGRAALHPGQGRGQFDQPEGGRGGVRAPGRLIRRYGAAVVVMAFDEEGQAVTCAIARSRSSAGPTRILTERSGFRPRRSFSIPTS